MKRIITGGLYLVVDPAIPEILLKIESVLCSGVDVIQVWENWTKSVDKIRFINDISFIAHAYNVPVILNNEWELLLQTEADGVHFDTLPHNWSSLKPSIGRPILTGVTCGNDIVQITKAIEADVDYLSFCSMFPSSSAGTCELVNPEVVLRTRQMTNLPIFVSGGITPENATLVSRLGVDGVAVISGILKSPNPDVATRAFKRAINTDISI